MTRSRDRYATERALERALSRSIARTSVDLFRTLVEALAGQGVAATRTALADLLKVRPATITSWISGRTAPTIDRVLEVALLAGVDIERLVAVPVTPWNDPEAAELLRLFRTATPAGRSFVLDAARHAPKRRRGTRPDVRARIE